MDWKEQKERKFFLAGLVEDPEIGWVQSLQVLRVGEGLENVFESNAGHSDQRVLQHPHVRAAVLVEEIEHVFVGSVQ